LVKLTASHHIVPKLISGVSPPLSTILCGVHLHLCHDPPTVDVISSLSNVTPRVPPTVSSPQLQQRTFPSSVPYAVRVLCYARRRTRPRPSFRLVARDLLSEPKPLVGFSYTVIRCRRYLQKLVQQTRVGWKSSHLWLYFVVEHRAIYCFISVSCC
jgi:hypothetical protein